MFDPGLLHRVQGVTGKPLHRRDGAALKLAQRQLAGSGGVAVQPHGASAALRNTTPVFGSHQTQMIAQRPQQGRIGVNVTHICQFTIDRHVKRHNVILFDQPALGRQMFGKGVSRPADLRRSLDARDAYLAPAPACRQRRRSRQRSLGPAAFQWRLPM